MIQAKKFIGYLATDSDGFQYLHKRDPKRLKYKNSKMIDNNHVKIPEKGEWKSRKDFKEDVGLYKFLLGKQAVNHTWLDIPVRAIMTLEVEE